MDWAQLAELLKGLIGDNPMMLMLVVLAVYLMKSIFPAPVVASDRVGKRLLDRLRLAADLGDEEAVARIARMGAEDYESAVKAEAGIGSGVLIDWFKNMFAGGNMMPLLLIGGVLFLFMSKGGGCGLVKSAQPVGVKDAAAVSRLDGEFGEFERGGLYRPVAGDAFGWFGADGASVGAAGCGASGAFRVLGVDLRGPVESFGGSGGMVDGPGASFVDFGGFGVGACGGNRCAYGGGGAGGGSRAVSGMVGGRRWPVLRAAGGVCRRIVRPFGGRFRLVRRR